MNNTQILYELKNKILGRSYELVREYLFAAYLQFESGDYEACFETLQQMPDTEPQPEDLTQFMQAI